MLDRTQPDGSLDAEGAVAPFAADSTVDAETQGWRRPLNWLRRAEGKPAGGEAKKESLVRGKLALDPQRHECTWEGKPVRLTVTEFLILYALAQRPGVVKSRNALMDAAYDDQVYVDDRTIDSHIKRLRKKFKVVDDDFEMIETLYGVGYRFKEA